MKTIVVPFDFSSYSLEAVKTAQKLSAKSGAEIICVTVIPSEVDWEKLSEEAKTKYPDLLEQYEEAKELLPGYIRDIAPAKVPILQQIRIGMPHELILRVVEESKADLLVLGAHGKGYTEGNFIGSTLQKVLRKSTCPVLAVKEAMNGNDFKKVAFASNFGPSSKNAFDKIKSLIKVFRTSVHLLYVNTPEHFASSDEIAQSMNSFTHGNEEIVFHQHVFNDKEVENGIIHFTSNHDIAWVVLVSGKRSSSSSYLIGTTETLLYKSKLGVLSVTV
ncbi:universal stress protein [Algoriphagus namhaensis]|uniref:Universal stress protein n=1 Tax=Algoriphagus namhaensis TaxID=915353 RepID=A0ABV8AU76_9BACT